MPVKIENGKKEVLREDRYGKENATKEKKK